MKERPLILRDYEVQALLDGRMSMFARPVKPQLSPLASVQRAWLDEKGFIHWVGGSGTEHVGGKPCPFGNPGERLWVRETFWASNDWDAQEYGPTLDCGSMLPLGPDYCEIQYCATPVHRSPPSDNRPVEQWDGKSAPGDWWHVPDEDRYPGAPVDPWGFLPWCLFTKHSSAQMPRWASRRTLEVTDRRIIRLQDTTEAEARAMGFDFDDDEAPTGFDDKDRPTALGDFRYRWDCTYLKKGLGWRRNPWVWAVTHKVVE